MRSVNAGLAKRLLLSLSALALLIPALSRADDSPPKPNFSGQWNMVKDKSDFGHFAGSTPDSVVYTIDHRKETVSVHVVQQRDKTKGVSDLVYYTDGRDSINEASGRESKSHCFWDGATLVIRTDSHTSRGEHSTAEIRWALSDDKKTLTMTSHIETDHIQDDFKMVLTRATP